MHTTDCIQRAATEAPGAAANRKSRSAELASGISAVERISGVRRAVGPPSRPWKSTSYEGETSGQPYRVWSQVQTGTSLEVQLLRLRASTAGGTDSIPKLGELRSHMLHGTAKTKEKAWVNIKFKRNNPHFSHALLIKHLLLYARDHLSCGASALNKTNQLLVALSS